MVTWRNRIKSLPWRKVMSDKTLVRLTEIMSKIIKFVKVYYAKLQKTSVYKKISSKISKVPKKYKIVGVIVCILAILVGVHYLLTSQPKIIVTGKQTAVVTPKLVKGTPNYTTILPQGESINSLGGWTRISPSSASPVYTYVDKIDTIQVNVSEQPLPDSFKANPAQQLAQLAQGENATEKITVAGTIVYIGTSSGGSQSIFFIKNNLLILIESVSTISVNSWVKYINSLQ
ncbi:MAG TPA: hypothetical protein VMR16_02140 [Candidatus Saccharimonadales bacterium]|nr:hypothetical protein [Candidatus Saccharimonadales bacterium]